MSVIDEYLDNLPEIKKDYLKDIANRIRHIEPSVAETISYGMPVFKYKGKYLIGICAFKNHMSIFPGAGAIEENEKLLANYVCSKGTVQFTETNPLSDTILEKLIKHRIKEIDKK